MTEASLAAIDEGVDLGDATVPIATVTIASEEYTATKEKSVVFGRQDGPGVVGLDPRDMGISGVAGSIEWKGLWLVSNRSRKRGLAIDDGAGAGPRKLECGQCHAVNVPTLKIRVRGEIYTHTIVVVVPEADLGHLLAEPSSSGTTFDDIVLTDRERAVAMAIFEGYLLPFPRRQAWPRTYSEAAARMGPPWTAVRVRKQMERLKERLSRQGPAFEGKRANYDLAEYLLANQVISPDEIGYGRHEPLC